MKTLYGIQYLRAFAALGVVIFHAAAKVGGNFTIGAAGVDVFFVISGFIMWVITERRPTTPWQFFRERWLRIAPVYWLVTAVMIVGALIGLFPNLKLTLGHSLGSLFFIPVRSPSTGEIWPVLTQGWTLDFEMFFYLIFAGALFLPRPYRLPTLAVIFTGLVTLGALLDPTAPIPQTYTNPIILEFVGGMLIAELWSKYGLASTGFGLGCIALACAGFLALYIGDHAPDVYVCGPLAMALVLGVVLLESKDQIGRWSPLAYLGDASYSIYLWHTLAISVVAKAAPKLGASSSMTIILGVVAGVLIGSMAYEILEKPLRKFLAFRRHKRRSPAVTDTHANNLTAAQVNGASDTPRATPIISGHG
jgi:exopolysaccharide production protein ExoZ